MSTRKNATNSNASPKRSVKAQSELRTKQFVNAVRWLEFMTDIKSYAQLARLLKVSPASISGAMNGKKVSERLAARLEERCLKRHDLTLEGFTHPYLVNTALKSLDEIEFAAMVSTKMVAIEATLNIIMGQLVTMTKKIGELQRVKKVKKKK